MQLLVTSLKRNNLKYSIRAILEALVKFMMSKNILNLNYISLQIKLFDQKIINIYNENKIVGESIYNFTLISEIDYIICI